MRLHSHRDAAPLVCRVFALRTHGLNVATPRCISSTGEVTTPMSTSPRTSARLLATGLALAASLTCFASNADAQSSPSPCADEARVVSVHGAVEILGAETHPAREGERLTRGQRIRTAADATATLALANGSLVEVDPNSLLVMFASPTTLPGASPSSVTTLVRGSLHVHASSAGLRAQPIPIETQAVTVWSGRSDAMIAADLGGHITRMAVWRGRMRVRMGTREYLLTQGYGVQEEVGHRPGVLQQLPRAPVWRASPPTRLLSFGEALDISGQWAPNPRAHAAPASEWKVQVARDETFRDLVESVRVPVNTTRWTGRSYAPGTYHVRVVAIDVNRFESTSSAVARIEIAAPTVLPATEGPDERRAMVRIPRGFYCGLDGAPLTSSDEQLTLTPGRPHSLRCASDASGRNARERLIPAGLSGPLRREIEIGTPSGDSDEGPAVGSLSLRLRDATGEPVSLARIEAEASDGVVVDAVRETEQRGVYTATLRWPSHIRACRVRFTINEALRFEQDARAERVRVVTPQATAIRHDPERVHIDTIRMAPPPDPDDEAPFDREE